MDSNNAPVRRIVLSSSENVGDHESKTTFGTLGKKLGALTNKLRRKTSSTRSSCDNQALVEKDRRKCSSTLELDENAHPSGLAKVPLRKDTLQSTDSVFLSVKDQAKALESKRAIDRKPHQSDSSFWGTPFKNEARPPINSLDDSKMIAPHNPPPPIPALNGAVFPKRNQVGSATDFLPANGFSKPALNGTHPVKQNGTPQPSLTSSSVAGSAQKPPTLPAKVEKEKSIVKDGHLKDLADLPRYPKIKLNGYVGFASLPYQVVRRSQQRGFQFNLMCVGETGTGKTTLIESLFGIKLSDFEPCNNELNTVELRSKQCEITDSNVNVKLRIVETAGFGDQLDKEKSAKVIVDFINSQFEARLKEELMVKRCLSHSEDKRIHLCLYFVSPTGHGLKALDIVAMKELSKRVNLIPVIAKSDTTSKDELARFKVKVLSELRVHNIEIYQFPTDDETVAEQNRKMNALIPFAVVGSVDFMTKEDGSVVRARVYPWGFVEIENKDHCDFIYLREAILRTNVDALLERTQNVLYESYRRERLRALKMSDGDAGPNMERACELRQREFKEELEKRDKKFNENFVQRVDEKEMELKRRDELVSIRRRDIEKNYQDELRALEQKIVQTSEEKARMTDSRFFKKSKK